MNAGSVVKSIQRGAVSGVELQMKTTHSINITPVNINKSVLISDFFSGSDNDRFKGVAVSFNGTTISIYNGSTYSIPVGYYWSVIEFY